MVIVFILLVLFQIKHFIADYPLQTPYMLRKFLPDWGYVLPLLAHTGVHAILTFRISIFFVSLKIALLLSLFDLIVHFIMDRIKASPNMLGKFEALSKNEFKQIMKDSEAVGYPKYLFTEERLNKIKSNTYFWWCLGIDQMVHHLTHYVIIWFLV